MASETTGSGITDLLKQEPGFWACATLVLVALVAAASLWGPGMVNTRGGGDSPFLLQRTHQMLVNLQAGVFPVRWMPDAAYGLGYPFFSYYAALPYYLAGLFALAGLDLLTALKLVQTIGFMASALTMYGWVRGMTRSHWAAWLAAVAYTVAPYHLVNVYVRGDSLSEFYAFIFYPLILWSLDTVCNRQLAPSHSSFFTRHCLPIAALAYAGLILTHNLSAFMFSPFVLLYLAVLARRAKVHRWRVFGAGVAALGLGFLLSAWYWLPAAAETGLVQLGPSTEDFFHYSRHFRTFNLVQRSPLFNYSIGADQAESSPFAMGFTQAAFASLGVLVVLGRGLRRRLDARWTFVLLGLLISTAMITPLSKPLWDHLPLLPVVQFPWRFLSVQTLFTAAAAGALLPDGFRDRRLASAGRGLQSAILGSQFAIVALPVAVVLTLSVLLPLHPERLLIDPDDVTVERLQLYELFAGNIGTTIRYEWLPKTVSPRPFTSDALTEPETPPRAIPLDGASIEAVLAERGPVRQVWRVWGDGGAIAFPLLYWPGWSAQVNGDVAAAWPVEGSGYLATEVPPGEHTVILQLGHTPVRAAAEWTSLAAVLALAAVSIKGQFQKSKPQTSEAGTESPGSRGQSSNSRLGSLVVYLLLAVLSVSVLLPVSRQDFDSDADLTMDFDLMPYLHHNPEGVDFSGVARLAGYDLSAEELSPGDTLTVALNWTDVAAAGYTARVQLVSPAAVRYDVEPVAEASCSVQSPAPCSIALRLPGDVSRGVYLLQLQLVGPAGEVRARSPGGATRGALYLRPVRVPLGPSLAPDRSVLAPFGPSIRLHAATVTQPTADRLAVQLAWSTTQPVAANYGVSLRLFDAEGQIRVSLDTQPGYGFLPTSLWRPGERISDPYILALPEDLPLGDGYHLEVVLYRVSTLEPVGLARLDEFALPLATPFEARRPPRSFSLPPLRHQLGVDFGGEVRLTGYDLELGGDALRLTMWWQALQAPQADYTVFVHLFDPATEALVAQSDAQPRGGAYPTSWWTTGEVVSETVVLPLGQVPEATYELAIGLYDQAVTRLPALDSDGQRLPDDRVILPERVEAER